MKEIKASVNEERRASAVNGKRREAASSKRGLRDKCELSTTQVSKAVTIVTSTRKYMQQNIRTH